MGELDGKVAIVTGAGRGLGRQHALLLAAEGAKVVVNDLGGTFDGSGADPEPARAVVEEIRAMGGAAIANVDDVADWEAGRRMVQAAVETYGDLHVLVNNAGIGRGGYRRYFEEIGEDDWDSMIEVHLKGHFTMLRHATEYWESRARAGHRVDGSVVNTSSPAGFTEVAGSTRPTQLHYSVAKAGILAMTTCAAAELGRYGVRVNAIAPGARTRMTEWSMPDLVAAPEDPAVFDRFDPANVSPVVAWLASERCRFTGMVLRVFANTIELYEGWTSTGAIDKEGRWSLGELDEELKRLVGGHTGQGGRVGGAAGTYARRRDDTAGIGEAGGAGSRHETQAPGSAP